MLNLDFSIFTWSLVQNFIVKGFIFSLQLTLVAMLGGIVLGTILALMRLSSKSWLVMPAAAYVNTMRSIPLVMVILWFFLLIPLLSGKPLGAEMSAMITFTLFEAAYYSEIMRAGIQSIPKGQVAAGYALGMTYGQTVLARAAFAAGIGWDPNEAHSAVYDAEQTARLFCIIANAWPTPGISSLPCA